MAKFNSDGNPSPKAYWAGYIYSLILTLLAYFTVSRHWLGGGLVVAAIACLAIVQLMVQLVCFLYLGRESKPYWNITVLSFAATVVIILVFGSVWIMNHLSYNMSHTPPQLDHSIMKDEGIGR